MNQVIVLSVTALRLLADQYLSQGDISTAVLINPVNWKYRFYYANKLRSEKKYKFAVEEIRNTIRLNPYHINSWNNLAVNYLALGRGNDAVKVLKNALKISPKNRIIKRNLNELFRKIPALKK